jgi:hypothetical protein
MGNTTLWAGTSFGLYMSKDGGKSWTDDNDSITPSSANSLSKSSSNSVFVSTNLGVYRLNYNNGYWVKTFPVSGYRSGLKLYQGTGGDMYIADPSIAKSNHAVTVYKSSDNGKTWAADTAGISAAAGNLFFIDETGGMHSANTFYGGSFKSDFWSRSAGGNWTEDTTGIPLTNYSYFSSIGSDLQGYLYTMGYISGSVNHNMLYRKPISGGAWTADTAGLGNSVTSKMTAGGKSGLLIWGGNKILHRSAGMWKPVSLPTGISYPNITAVSADGNSVIFAAFKDVLDNPVGVYYTSDTGKNWTYAGLAKTDIASLVSFGDTTYVLTSSNWVYRMLAQPYVNTGVLVNEPSREATLYPNPAHDLAELKYTVSEKTSVKIELYNTLGQRVSNTSCGEQQEGEHVQKIDVQSLKPGIYLYRVSMGNNCLTGRLMKE